METISESDVSAIVAAGERILSERLGRGVRLRAGEVHHTGKSTVVRCRHINPPDDLPASFIAKRPAPDRDVPAAHSSALLSEWAALELLTLLSDGQPVAPRFYGGNLKAGVIVMEDLGDDAGSDTLALVKGNDPARAEAALVEHAALIGRLHALSADGIADYQRIRERLGAARAVTGLFAHPWPSARLQKSAAGEINSVIKAYQTILESVGIRAREGVREEIARVSAAVEEEPGPFLALCQGDQNLPGGSRRCDGRLRLYDFDCGGFRHALLEGLPGRLSWGCVMRIPDRVIERMEPAYRRELVKGCAVAADDDVFHRAMIEAAARWHVFQVLSRLPDCLTVDATRGPTTRRQQFLAWMDGFAGMTREFGLMTALGDAARELAARMHERWPPEVHPLPVYPAFRHELQ
ncbi:MAG TPA: hypothetical protein VFD58_34665 [Blastocatellia bacterium]|nr:hypothetical protein [Blastocatellia bacterium]